MLSIFIREREPYVKARSIACPGWFVCTWTLTISSSATRTIESPIEVRNSLKECSSSIGIGLFRRMMNSVQYPNLISASACGEILVTAAPAGFSNSE